MNDLCAKDLHWFQIANAGGGQDFYAFKHRFLKRFAVPDGFDLQHMPKICWNCDGSGEYAPGVECRKCDGSGIYDIAEHWLRRWNLSGTIYHIPMTHADVYHLHVYKYPEPVREIEGKISHADVPYQVARRAYWRLLIRHEPMNFYWTIIHLVKEKMYWTKTKWVFRLIRLRNKMDLFKTVPEDDVPF